MHKFAILNGNFVDPSSANIAASSAAALYGRGIFTTIAIYDGKPFLLEKHFRRLRGNAEKINLDIASLCSETLESSLRELIAANGVENGRARITVFDESSSGMWPSKKENKTSVLVLTGNLRDQTADIRLTFSPFPINSASPLTGVKSCNYLENLLAYEGARKQGFNEAVRVNEGGEIASACLANFFWLKDDKLFTPHLETGCLAGTTREFILENVPCEEVKAGRDTLSDADGLFICSAGIGIRPVTSLDKKIFRARSIYKCDKG